MCAELTISQNLIIFVETASEANKKIMIQGVSLKIFANIRPSNNLDFFTLLKN